MLLIRFARNDKKYRNSRYGRREAWKKIPARFCPWSEKAKVSVVPKLDDIISPTCVEDCCMTVANESMTIGSITAGSIMRMAVVLAACLTVDEGENAADDAIVKANAATKCIDTMMITQKGFDFLQGDVASAIIIMFLSTSSV